MARYIKELIARSKLLFLLRVFGEKFQEAVFLLPRLSSGQSNWKKIEPVLRIEIHAIEKGMSIGDVHPGFGKTKVHDLLTHLQHYLDVGGRKSFSDECCSVLKQYLDFNRKLGADMDAIESELNLFIEKNHSLLSQFGGIREVSIKEICIGQQSDFAIFSQCRHAIRDFDKSPIQKDLLEKALRLVEKTPSACNRQGWKVHVYSSYETRMMIFNLQGGSRGFSDDMQYAILICGDLNYYRFYELNQVYVDGGLYAMNLLYALQYYGIASIPLTMSMRMSKLRGIIKAMDLPHNEIPILLIGAGAFKDSFRVAQSERIPFYEYTTFEG